MCFRRREGGVITEEFVADAHSLVKLLSADDDAVDEGEEGRSEFARRSFSKFVHERREAVATPALRLQKKTHVVASQACTLTSLHCFYSDPDAHLKVVPNTTVSRAMKIF